MNKFKVRNAEIRDWNSIESIHDGSFPFPRLTDDRYIIQKSVLNEDKLIGFTCTILTTETILMLDPKLNSFGKAKAIKALHEELEKELIAKKLPETIMFLTKEESSTLKILQKLGHEEVKGKPVVWQGKRRK